MTVHVEKWTLLAMLYVLVQVGFMEPENISAAETTKVPKVGLAPLTGIQSRD